MGTHVRINDFKIKKKRKKKRKNKKNAFESVLMRWMKCIYMKFRKMVMVTLYARQQKRHRCKEQTFGPCGRRRGWDDLRE